MLGALPNRLQLKVPTLLFIKILISLIQRAIRLITHRTTTTKTKYNTVLYCINESPINKYGQNSGTYTKIASLPS